MISLTDGGGKPKDPDFDPVAAFLELEREMAKLQDGECDEAQQLVYDAMEAATAEEELELLERALTLDPGNVDALLAAMRYLPLTEEATIKTLQSIVKLAAQRLGPEAFKELAGQFWAALETRPYMRARAELADALYRAGRIEAAVAEWEGMLELNENDNQGVRYRLLPCYLALKRLKEAARLFAKYDECEWNTMFAWGRVLERVLREDFAGAEAALAVARKQNTHTEAYLSKRKRLPKQTPLSYQPGSKEEAACFAEDLLAAWKRYPEAQRWLAEHPSRKRARGGKQTK